MLRRNSETKKKLSDKVVFVGHAQKFINTRNSEREPVTYRAFLTRKIIKTRNINLYKNSYF